ncbi:terminase small subunit [Cytobacillus praedii]|uniref:terminase small subunit n=1 Tax=Cytobacillus praedii TaxID=1742358 RepID=UPI00070B6FAA|nr:terminase small subunit [Cytobacillus praedii]
MSAGRPLKFKNADELEEAIRAYFDYCDERVDVKFTKEGEMIEIPNPRPYTISGLAYYLGTTRQTLLNYEQKDEFFDTVRAAKAKIEAFVEESLWTPKVAQGVVFNLKNNFGWEEKQSLEHSGPDGSAIKFVSSTPEVVNEDEWNNDN